MKPPHLIKDFSDVIYRTGDIVCTPFSMFTYDLVEYAASLILRSARAGAVTIVDCWAWDSMSVPHLVGSTESMIVV